MLEVERSLIAGRPPRYVQIPTAAAQEGAGSLDRWVSLGREQARRLGVESVPVVARTREEADDPELAALVEDAGLIYLSGGDPHFLASTLRGTALWAAVEHAWASGAALAGCSAGAMAMTSWVPSVKRLGLHPDPGLGALPHLRVIPHFDTMGRWMPDLVTRVLLHAPPGVTVLGIDEETAVVGGPHEWQVVGRQSVWVLGHGSRREVRAGEALETP